MAKKDSNGKKRVIWPVLAGCAVYLCMLLVLVWTEQSDPSASIDSLADAFWYSVVTLSTVGYGDLYPVTTLGRILGAVFVLMSVGVLSFIISAMVSFLTAKLIPGLRRRALRDRQWFVFSEVNEASLALAEDLLSREPEGVCLFPESQRESVPGNIRAWFYAGALEQALQGKQNRCSLFFMDEQSGSNYAQALKALPLGYPVYCRTEQAPDQCPQGLTLFNRYDCCAREYWRTNGIEKEEKCVILIGSGRYARQLLFRGLLMNVFGRGRRLCYHIFGDWADFCRNHPQLSVTLFVDSQVPEKDCLVFHTDPWNRDEDLLCRADRIILCSDEETENLTILRQIRQFFPVKGKLHLRSAMEMPGETVFGTNRMTYTAELVLKSRLTQTARRMHEIYREGAGYPVPAWEELSEFTRQSNISAADHLLTKLRVLMEDDGICEASPEICREAYRRYQQCRPGRDGEFRRMEHLRWMRFHSLYNWRYAPVRDNQARLHPLMVPFEELTPEEQRKDDYAWELLGELQN